MLYRNIVDKPAGRQNEPPPFHVALVDEVADLTRSIMTEK
jgi:hypothetical protein